MDSWIFGGVFISEGQIITDPYQNNLQLHLDQSKESGTYMRVIIELPLDDYHLCMPRFPMNSPEYRMLKNGIVVRNDRNEEVIHIRCERETGLALRKLFADACPEAVYRIKELPDNNGS